MATIKVNTYQNEQEDVLEELKKLQNQTVSVSRIASEAGMKQSRVRYALEDLIEAGKVAREASKAINKHYVRYSYKVIKEWYGMKIYRFSGYYCTTANISSVLSNLKKFPNRHIHIDEADLPINEYPSEKCDLADLEKYFVDKKYKCREEEVVIGGTYRHFKGNIVKVLNVARYTEDATRSFVVYSCSNGVYARPLDMFLSEVDKCKYPDTKQKYRFELIEEDK